MRSVISVLVCYRILIYALLIRCLHHLGLGTFFLCFLQLGLGTLLLTILQIVQPQSNSLLKMAKALKNIGLPVLTSRFQNENINTAITLKIADENLIEL